jgi:hypothetical protein
MDIQSIGGNWYSLYVGADSLEYNTGLNPTANLYRDRKPQASVFRHIDGNKVVARIEGEPEQSFSYKKYGYKNAHVEATNYVENFFKEASGQKDIFNAVWSAD